MSWIVDNASVLYVLFGIVAAGLLMFWRNNRQTKYLGFTVGVVAIIALVWLATQFYISDKQQLEMNVRAMRDAVLDHKPDELFKHVSKDFTYKGSDRDMTYTAVKTLIRNLKHTDIGITSFEIVEISREKSLAKTSFLVTPHPNREMFRTEADFVLEGDQWKLKTLRFYMAHGGDEVDVPGLR